MGLGGGLGEASRQGIEKTQGSDIILLKTRQTSRLALPQSEAPAPKGCMAFPNIITCWDQGFKLVYLWWGRGVFYIQTTTVPRHTHNGVLARQWAACPRGRLHLSENKKPKSTIPWVLVFEAQFLQVAGRALALKNLHHCSPRTDRR